ncbi:hypothetical protein FM037_03470 [Shewanella psychropiezotolerans]|uniref:Uncharacterized protein n=1 Tax=Shewanella psychropiezotolerans TaxID=2593655 RepID=A0ABX5WUA4_9GAMM|nr:hypothetical protein [Shewanella psychropiezotolerans]QDO82473.1 hypothetical protein FM037_03470 [Shewanella psychropiezotolerans]
MEPISTGIAIGLVSNVIFKALCISTTVTVDILKKHFDNPPSDEILQQIASKAQELEIDDEWSPKRIERAIGADPSFLQMLSASNITSSTIINQHHTGTGDNVAGDKIVTG